jgi:hypothetical protein
LAKSGVRDPGRARARDLAHGKREVCGRHELAGAEKHGAVGVETFGVLARDDEVDRRAATRQQAAAAARRTDIGKQIETLAQLARRVEAALRDGRIVVVRHRPEDHAIRRFGRLDRRRRQGRAVRAQGRKPNGHRRERKAELEEVIRRANNRHGRSRDLRPDAVAFHHQDADRRG